MTGLERANPGERQQKRVAGSNVELKADASGEFVALVYLCTGEADLDGDLIPPSAFRAGDDCVVSQWNHSAFSSDLPAGRGTLKVDGNRVLLSGRFNLEASHGRDTYETVKQLDERCEWSIGYAVQGASYPSPEQEAAGVVRVVNDIEVYEVSPVLKGAAGPGRSGTVAIKAAEVSEHNANMIALRERYIAAERKASHVPRETRISAERGLKLAGYILARGKTCQLPRIRYFAAELSDELKVAGTVFSDRRGEFWLREDLDPEHAVDAAAHEAAHIVGVLDEDAVKRFGRLVAAVDRERLPVRFGEPDTTPVPSEDPAFLVTPRFELFKSFPLLDDDRPPFGTKIWHVPTGRYLGRSTEHGHPLPDCPERLRMCWEQLTLLL